MAVNIKLKHSSIDSKAPVASDLENGELALNVNANSPAAYIKDSAGNIVKLAGADSVSTADPDAVKKSETASQNMVGDLTLGTDKITLDASTGAGTFSGTGNDNTILVKDGTTENVQIKANGIASFNGRVSNLNGFHTQDVPDTSGAFSLNDANGTPISYILGDGSATFAGDVTTVGNTLYGSWGLLVDSAGADGQAVQVNQNGAVRATIDADGSATFCSRKILLDDDGKISCGDADGSVQHTLQPTGDATFAGGNISFDSTGSAEFESYVSSDTFFWSKNTDSVNAGLYLYNYDGNPNRADAAFAVSPTNGSSAHTVTIDYDGKATFAGTVWSNGGTATNYAFLATGDVNTAKGIGVFNAGGVNVAEINLDGSATFANFVLSGSVEAGGGGGNYLSFGEVASYAPNGTSPVFRGWNAGTGGANELGVTILADGSASFEGTTQVGMAKTGGSLAFSVGGAFGSGSYPVEFTGNGAAIFIGTVTATVVPPSDARFKENITPAKPQLADVVALGGLLKNYDWNDQAPLNEEIRSQRQLGLIAQEAAEVCPAIVKDIHKTKQGAVITPEEIIPAVVEPAYTIPAVTKEVPNPRPTKKGETITIEVEPAREVPEKVIEPERVIPATYEELDDSYKGISTDALIMKLIGAVAELSAEVTALKAAKLTKK